MLTSLAWNVPTMPGYTMPSLLRNNFRGFLLFTDTSGVCRGHMALHFKLGGSTRGGSPGGVWPAIYAVLRQLAN